MIFYMFNYVLFNGISIELEILSSLFNFELRKVLIKNIVIVFLILILKLGEKKSM